MSKTSVAAEIETFRTIVTDSSTSGDVMPRAEECCRKLNELFEADRTQFTPEDIRFVNALKGILTQRQSKYVEKGGPYSNKGKRRGDELPHCWRCELLITSQFTDFCKTCSEVKGYQFRVCPACGACGCQRGNKVLV